MAKISLRSYTREIETLIDGGKIDEAIAHSKSILKIYPKHIDSYRLLGKAYLETQRYGEAADVLQRVLSVVPDDFVSQIGMSIIREDEGNLDQAIWHMERAFEVQPSNSAIQDELRRLFGKRDGIQPPRIRLTRGALVRMYARGELYPQAIAEIKAALADDSSRIDLEIILARMYFLSGQRVEAAEVCSKVVKKLPYSYEANRILGEILPGTSRSEDAAVYQQRVASLDPYAAFLTSENKNLNDVPENAVIVEKLQYQSGEEISQQPEWAKSIGVDLQSLNEDLPDWLNSIAPEGVKDQTSPQEIISPVPADEQPNIGEELIGSAEGKEQITPSEIAPIPEWMKSAGWVPSEGISSAFTEIPAPKVIDEPEHLPAEIPDWLQSLAPIEGKNSTIDETEEAEKLELLDNILPPAEVPSLDGMEEPVQAVIDSVQTARPEEFNPDSPENEAAPDWLADLEAQGNAEPMAVADEDSGQQNRGVESEVLKIEPINLAGTSPSKTEEELAKMNQDWLNELKASVDADQATLITPRYRRVDTPPAWVRQDENKEPTPDAIIPAQSVEPLQEQSHSDVPDWLQSLTDDTSIEVKHPSEVPVAGEVPESTPEWLREMHEAESDLKPDEIEEKIEIPEAENIPDWIKGLAPASEFNKVESNLEPVARLSEPQIPDWLQEINRKSVEETSVDTPIAQEAIPAAPAAVPAELPPWLQEIKPATFEEPATQVPAPSGAETSFELPDWLRALDLPAPRASEGRPPVHAAPTKLIPTLPGWLWELEGEAPPVEELPVLAEEVLTQKEQFASDEIGISDSQESIPTGAEIPSWMPPQADETSKEVMETALASEELPIVEKEFADEVPLTGSISTEGSEPQEILNVSQLPVESEAVFEEPVEEISSAIKSPKIPSELEIDAGFAWLESLAAEQGADEETLLAKPGERIETPPSWVTNSQALENLPSTDANKEEIQVDFTPLAVESIIEPEFSEFQIEEVESEEILPEKEIANEGVGVTELYESAISPEAIEAIPQEQPVDIAPLAELPDWLKDIDNQQTESEAESEAPDWLKGLDTANIPPSTLPVNETDQQETDLPEWLRMAQAQAGMLTEAPSESTAIPEKSELPEWLSSEPVSEEVKEIGEAPMVFEKQDIEAPIEQEPEIQKAPEFSVEEEIPAAEFQQLKSEYVPEPVVTVPVSEDVQKLLDEDQEYVNSGQIDEALSRYDRLIQANRSIPEVITILLDASYRYPVDTSILQSLGDAYVRVNRLQDAIDTYTKAEELLR